MRAFVLSGLISVVLAGCGSGSSGGTGGSGGGTGGEAGGGREGIDAGMDSGGGGTSGGGATGGDVGGSGGGADASAGSGGSGGAAGGKPCGGIAGLTCGLGEWCDFANDSCGAGDQQGRCQPRGGYTASCGQPLCGCDGNSYPSPCAAHLRGTDTSATNACIKGNGGDSAACGKDSDCQTGYRCCSTGGAVGSPIACKKLPPGAACPALP
jgi:hypothetical protein